MWKLVPKSEAAELIPICIEAGLPMLWAAEGGAFITLDSHSYESHAKDGYGRLIVWIGDDKPSYSPKSNEHDPCITDAQLDKDHPNWRD